MTDSARIAHILHYFPYARADENLTMKARNTRKRVCGGKARRS